MPPAYDVVVAGAGLPAAQLHMSALDADSLFFVLKSREVSVTPYNVPVFCLLLHSRNAQFPGNLY